MREGRDYRTLRFDSDVGKHGDTGTSEVEVVRAVLDGRADAGAIGSPFWNTVRSEQPGARRRPSRDMVLAGLQPLHVHGTARSRPRAGAAVCRRARSHELRQPGASPDPRRRRTSALAAASRGWLRCIAGGRGPAGILRAGVGEISVGAIARYPTIASASALGCACRGSTR